MENLCKQQDEQMSLYIIIVHIQFVTEKYYCDYIIFVILICSYILLYIYIHIYIYSFV